MKVFHSFILLLATLLIAGCATSTSPASPLSPARVADKNYWQGRLALKIHTEPVQAFSADFELEGDAQTGTLTFSAPLGLTAAKLEWGTQNVQGAQLQAKGETQHFESMDALTLHVTGSKLPIASLFAWLQGETPPTPNWEIELLDLSNGRLSARRIPPEIPVDLKIFLER